MTKNAVAKSFTLYSWGDGTMRSRPQPTVPEWTLNEPQDLTPAAIVAGPILGQGIDYDPNNPGTALWCNGGFDEEFNTGEYNGIYRTTDFGLTWTRVGACSGGVGYIDNPVRVRYAGSRVIAVCGVRGTNQGLFVSTDGGLNFTRPAGFASALTTASVSTRDCYDFAIDPNDEDHILVSWHYYWEGSYGSNSGIAEGDLTADTWTVHPPESTWGTGHSVHFLCDPENEVGDSNTWLLGTQGDGKWRTANAGTSWTQVTEENIAHGGCQIVYDSAGAWLYAAGETKAERSDDNGATWETATSTPCWAVFGDRIDSIYTKHNSGTSTLLKAAESSGTSFSALGTGTFTGGIFEGRYDPATGIAWVSGWDAGPRGYRLRAV